MNVAALINRVNGLGIKLWQEEGQLKFKAPKGAWNAEIRDEVIAHKEKIVSFLTQVSKTNKLPPIQPIGRMDDDGVVSRDFPLSYVQEPLWFIERINSDAAGYNLPKAVTIKGNIKRHHLEEAINIIISRHESLRTLFPEVDNHPVQRVLEHFDFNLEQVDLSDIPDKAEAHLKLQLMCKKDAARPFDLSAGPLIRGTLYRISSEEHVLLLNLHHIISDAWSMGIFIKEFNSIIRDLLVGREPQLPEQSLQYVDYCVWQRNLLENTGLLERQLKFWTRKLSGIPRYLELPFDFPRPSIKTYSGSRFDFNMSADQTKLLKNLAEQKGCTLFMVIMAAFSTLLSRLSGQEDICIGSPIANRQHRGTENIIGMFINTLAFRNQIVGDDSFVELLAQVKQTCLEAFEHQETPFEKVVDAVQPGRSLAVDPIFQVMLVLQNTPREVPDQFIERYPLEGEVSKFDLDVEFMETPDGLSASIEYRTSLFKLSNELLASFYRFVILLLLIQKTKLEI